jgi:hypothetical protein
MYKAVIEAHNPKELGTDPISIDAMTGNSPAELLAILRLRNWDIVFKMGHSLTIHISEVKT